MCCNAMAAVLGAALAFSSDLAYRNLEENACLMIYLFLLLFLKLLLSVWDSNNQIWNICFSDQFYFSIPFTQQANTFLIFLSTRSGLATSWIFKFNQSLLFLNSGFCFCFVCCISGTSVITPITLPCITALEEQLSSMCLHYQSR